MDLQIVFIIIWAAIFITLLIIELSTTQLVSIWFCGGAIVSLILAIFDVNYIVQIIVFIVVSALLLLLTRPLVKSRLLSKNIPTNYDSLVGQEIMVIKPIKSLEESGLGKINDIYWTLISTHPINKGEYAIIKEIKGNKLVVAKKEKK